MSWMNHSIFCCRGLCHLLGRKQRVTGRFTRICEELEASKPRPKSSARLTGRTWSHDLRVVSWSLLVGVLFFAGSERERVVMLYREMYIWIMFCPIALFEVYFFTWFQRCVDTDILFFELWVYQHCLAPNDSHGKFPCAQSKAKCVLAWWIASDVASFCSAQFRYL